ncbi:hypothetical protein [uncultured Flavobacterium sp.]|nr:hypothetical protein [uncultured Flavobacterium sp.]
MKLKVYYLFLFIPFFLHSQSSTLINRFQYGATVKAKIEFRYPKHQEPFLNFRISTSAGIAGRWIVDELYPSANTEIQFYNGGLGSDSRPDARKLTLDAILAFTLTTGKLSSFYKSENINLTRNVPLRYFSDFAIPSLQNPYNYSASLGTNFAFTTDGNKSFQRIGFLNFLFGEGVQFSYYNDGTPFQYTKTGDGKDRYYTGGGILSYSHGNGQLTSFKSYQFELSYQKFTGFTQNSFELSNSLNTSNVDYKDTNQKYYNKSLWKFNIQSNNENNGYGLAFAYYNSIGYDGQHLIHWLISNSFHLVPYGRNFTIEPSSYLINNGFKN